MQELTSIEIDLARRRVLKMEPLNRRIVKMGFAKLQAIKRDSLPIIENFSPSKRYKTQRSEDQTKYFNQFCQFTYEENQDSKSSIRVKKQLQPMCMYKKPRIRENVFSFRKKMAPKISDKKLKEETVGNNFMQDSSSNLEIINVVGVNVSTISLGQDKLITFYPYKKARV